MPVKSVNGVELFYEVTGEGFPLVFNHELGGDYRSWESQVRFFARRFKVITYNNRGFPPSEVPVDPEAYSETNRVEDLYQLLRALAVTRAHVVGLSMGGNLTLNFGIAHPELCASLVIAGCGAGSSNREAYEKVTGDVADLIERQGIEAIADGYCSGPIRSQLKRKDPRGWQEFRDQFGTHSATGTALTLRGVQLRRPSILALESRLKALTVPTLIVVGDEDEACLEPAMYMKRHIPCSGLAVFPQSGHTLNLEEPALFNSVLSEFFTMVEAGKWARRGFVAPPGTELLPGKA